MRHIDARGQELRPYTAYGTATLAAVLLASTLSLGFAPEATGPLTLAAVGLGCLHALIHDSQGSLVDTGVAIGFLTILVGAVPFGLLAHDPLAVPAGLIAAGSQIVWFLTFALLHRSLA